MYHIENGNVYRILSSANTDAAVVYCSEYKTEHIRDEETDEIIETKHYKFNIEIGDYELIEA